MNRYAVIMAGGGGSRFWPLSRKNTPKQFLNLSGNDVMINETIKRYDGVIPLENTFIVTNRSQREMVENVLLKQIPLGNILVEPQAKNTAPCILYAALVLMKNFGDGIMCVFPSDHYITDENRFRVILEKAIQAANDSGKIVTVGIKPTFPSTGYGYIYHRPNPEPNNESYEVLEFIEKPNFEKAKKFLESGNYLWNSGMFVWKTSVIIENFKRFLPHIYERMQDYYQQMNEANGNNILDEVYSALPNISIDFGILERSTEVTVIPGDFGWSDIGSWDALGAIFPPDENGNIIKADHIGINTKDSVIYGNGRLLATVGVDGLVVVETDDAVLVCRKDQAQDVKKVVEMLERDGRVGLL